MFTLKNTTLNPVVTWFDPQTDGAASVALSSAPVSSGSPTVGGPSGAALPSPGGKGPAEEPEAGWGAAGREAGVTPPKGSPALEALSPGSHAPEPTPPPSGRGGALTPLTTLPAFPPAACSPFLLLCPRFRPSVRGRVPTDDLTEPPGWVLCPGRFPSPRALQTRRNSKDKCPLSSCVSDSDRGNEPGQTKALSLR